MTFLPLSMFGGTLTALQGSDKASRQLFDLPGAGPCSLSDTPHFPISYEYVFRLDAKNRRLGREARHVAAFPFHAARPKFERGLSS